MSAAWRGDASALASLARSTVPKAGRYDVRLHAALGGHGRCGALTGVTPMTALGCVRWRDPLLMAVRRGDTAAAALVALLDAGASPTARLRAG